LESDSFDDDDDSGDDIVIEESKDIISTRDLIQQLQNHPMLEAFRYFLN
jgi:hypothetical protein